MALDILQQRLHNQLLSQTKFTQPSQVVAWLGAVQSQDYAGAKWALSLRTNGLTDAAIEQAFTNGEILRTHVMRPTWHFVTPQDIRWLLALTAPRVLALLAYMDRQLGVEKTFIKQTNRILAKALKGGKQLTRAEIASVLQGNGIKTDGLRLGHIVMHAELDGIICSGARRGKQFTYALLEERAPQAKTLERDAALAELTKRYFRSHGPATLKDFVWWSGLTMADARTGIDFVKSQVEREVIELQTYWFAPSQPERQPSPTAFLLPNYDEYTVGYTDRSAIFDVSYTDKLGPRESILAQSTLIDGRVTGTWKRTIKKNEVVIELAPFSMLTADQNQTVIAATQQYGKFLGLPVVLTNTA
ncbi:MAG TPA: winged helix DNA-binding domain-containing protein [Anaerolineales bacterium]|nr:winged helix DNA-binding domain-containing protein [Anaerolineales bacterium]